MSSLKKSMTLATLLNRNKLPACCSSVTEKEGGEEERTNVAFSRGVTFTLLLQGHKKAGLHCNRNVYTTQQTFFHKALPACGWLQSFSGSETVTH